ncbi:glycoside hydrolase family 16 protein [Schizophyllum commune]
MAPMRSLSLLALYALARSAYGAPANASSTNLATYSVYKDLSGQAFLDFFHYDVHPSDNEGVANYVDGPSNGLTYVDGNGKVVVAVETTNNVNGLRKAVRMVSTETFNPSQNLLFIFDVQQMPAACGTWPALWFTGANWPYDGEMDVIEGVNKYVQNVMSVHTGPGCYWPDYTMGTLTDLMANEPQVHSCDATVDYMSCGGTQKSKTSFGEAFNNAGGGVFTLEFLQTGIVMHFWNRNEIPQDILNGNPTPYTWGKETYWIPQDQCNISDHFKNQMLVINTNLGGTYPLRIPTSDLRSGAGSWITQSCKKQTGANTAKDYVLNNGWAFADAGKWPFGFEVIAG